MKMIAKGWLGTVTRVEVDAAYYADELERLKDDVKRAEFRAKLFAAKIARNNYSRMYCGKSDLNNQITYQ